MCFYFLLVKCFVIAFIGSYLFHVALSDVLVLLRNYTNAIVCEDNVENLNVELSSNFFGPPKNHNVQMAICPNVGGNPP